MNLNFLIYFLASYKAKILSVKSYCGLTEETVSIIYIYLFTIIYLIFYFFIFIV